MFVIPLSLTPCPQTPSWHVSVSAGDALQVLGEAEKQIAEARYALVCGLVVALYCMETNLQ